MHINSCIYLQPANHAVEQGEMHFRFRCYRTPYPARSMAYPQGGHGGNVW